MTKFLAERVVYWLLENKVAPYEFIETNFLSDKYRDLIKIYDNNKLNCIVLQCVTRETNGIVVEPYTFIEKYYPWQEEYMGELLGGLKAHMNRLNPWFAPPFDALNSPAHRLTMMELGFHAKRIKGEE